MKFVQGALLFLAPLAETRRLGKSRKKSSSSSSSSSDDRRRRGDFTAPHEVHQYEQTKFYNEPMWDCSFEDIGGSVGCMKCWNPGQVGDDALIVEVKAMYKRTDFNVKNETLDPPRKHCIWPERGDFWTCFNTNLVIEPDTDWLGDLSDKPIYNSDGSPGGDECYPGNLVADLPDNGAVQPHAVVMEADEDEGEINEDEGEIDEEKAKVKDPAEVGVFGG